MTDPGAVDPTAVDPTAVDPWGGRRPRFAIIGTQKSASTFLHRQLARHPDVWLPAAEVRVFEDPYHGETGLAPLQREVAAAPPGCVVGFRRPDLLAKPEVPARLEAALPGLRLLVTLRDPVDRAVSAYFHYLRKGWIPTRPLDAGIAALLDGRTPARYARAPEVLSFGRYAEQLARWEAPRRDGRLLVLLHEELLADPAPALERACAHIGVAPVDEVTEREPGVNASVYSMPRMRFLQVTRHLTRAYDPQRTRSRRRRGPVPAAINAVDRVLLRTLPSRKPQLRPDLRARLRAYYADDVARLETLLDRPLPGWRGEPSDVGGDAS